MTTVQKMMIGAAVGLCIVATSVTFLVTKMVDEGYKAYGIDYAKEVCIGKIEPVVAVDKLLKYGGETALEAYKTFDCEAHLKERAAIIKGE